MRPEHIPLNDPCELCLKPAASHRVNHKSEGDPCTKCKLAASNHRSRAARKDTRKRTRKSNWQKYKGKYDYGTEYRKKYKGRYSEINVDTFYGIDGEGQGRKNHKYVFLAVSNEDGSKKWSLENPNGIGTKEALDFILGLPSPDHRVRIFGYSLNYDWTKMLADIDDATLYDLFRPELRQRPGKEAMKGPYPVKWKGYRLNMQGTKFTIYHRGKRKVIWDIWKFYQSKFVNALRDWKVGDEESLTTMQIMKDKRHLFDKMPFDEVKKYCFQECAFMAALGRRLVEAHTAVGLKLRSFYGAGSSGGCMLKVMGVQGKIQREPEGMREAVACGFVGGRFENSVVGRIPQKVYNKDISAAYPYQLAFLPCLEHGHWVHSKKRDRLDSRDATQALVRYRLGDNPGYVDWAPFPFRTSDGSICFPIESGGGWVYRDEYLAGERLFSHVEFVEAWVYYKACDCRPFEKIPEYYKERLRIGKEGPGIVLKLGVNSCYGKLAQSVGNAIYNSWLWAGMITSGCRAQVLEVLGLHEDRSNMLMVATDGIYTKENVVTPTPKDTGTFEAGSIDKHGIFVKKPLGGWESTDVDRGVFIARPGIYFPLSPTEKDLKAVRGRGVGKGVVLENWQKIIDSWETHGMNQSAHVANVTRFCGAKSSISKSREGYTRADGSKSIISYGQWIKRTVEMGFHPMPKRAGVRADGVTLELRSSDSKQKEPIPKTLFTSPYKKAVRSYETKIMQSVMLEISEQPDIDFSDYEFEEMGGME